MERLELETITTMLINAWRGDVLEDSKLWHICRTLDELLRPLLPADTIRLARTRRAPKKCRMHVINALSQLIKHDPTAERLAKSLINPLQPTSNPTSIKLPSISIQGNNNQISVGPHLGAITQINNLSADARSKYQAVDTTRQDDSAPLLFKLALLQRGDKIEARAIQTPSLGQPCVTINAPYIQEELDAVLVVISDIVTGGQSLTDHQSEILRRHNLINNQRNTPRLLEQIGRHLYQQLFVDDLQVAFQSALNLARRDRKPLHLWLYMDEGSVMLARYPWELLHDGRRPLLASNAVELKRYITYPEAPTSPQLEPPLSLLYIAPRPVNLSPLASTTGHNRIPERLRELERSDVLRITELPTPTYSDLVDYLHHNDVQIFHFDGHGSFGRRCLCHINPPHIKICPSCNTNLADIPLEGYLAFEDNTGEAHLVPSSTLGAILYNRSIQLAILLACSSGVVHGNTLFTGIGPTLVQAGVPAVIATQSTISNEAAYLFTETFYQTLTRQKSIDTALHNGRQKLLLSHEWFIPVLYLHNED